MSGNFKFSVIMPIYNTEEYLVEAIDSIVNQDIGFIENVKLILVDDGSQDDSYDICLKYKEQYPDNIIALRKENGGQGSARNLGLEYVDSEYITFLDSDDKLSLNSLSVVYEFFLKHEGEFDIASIPLVYFDAREGDHILNYKFKTDRVVDLVKRPQYPQLAINSSFIKTEAFKDYRFNTNLATGEDAIIVNKILLEKKKIAFLNRAKYYYRKRQDESSTVDNAKSKREFFSPRLRDYFKVLIDYSLEKEGEVADFIQYIIAYDLQWYYNVSDFPEFLSKEEINEFWEYFSLILSYIDDDVINSRVIIKKNYVRFFLMYIKNHKDFHIEAGDSDLCLMTGDFTINQLSHHNIYIDNIESNDGYLDFYGSFTSSCDYDVLNIKAIKDGTEVYMEDMGYYENNSHFKRFLGINWRYSHLFNIKIPADVDEEFDLSFSIDYNENDISMALKNGLKFKKEAVLFTHISYSVIGSYIILFNEDENLLNVSPFSYKKINELNNELNSYIQELLDSNKALNRQNRLLNRANDSLKNRNDKLNQRNASLQNKNKKLKEDLSRTREKNKEILNSTSWKITEPLRKTKHLLDHEE